MRLQAAGGLDAAFGDSGQTWIDLKSKLASSPVVRDMLVREDGSVIAVGGAVNYDRPFVVRLMGEAGGNKSRRYQFHSRACRTGGKRTARPSFGSGDQAAATVP